MATELHLSSRTLKRRLADQGRTFTELQEQECAERAQHLLQTSQLSLAEIGDRLGYASLSSFTRAFRRWTEHTPAGYRGQARQQACASLKSRGPAHS